MVDLIPMSENEFQAYLGPAIAGYAEDSVRAGNVAPEQALSSAEMQFNSLLPEGLDTPSQHLFSIWDREQGRRVGTLWVGIREDGDRPFAALYDFLIFEAYRRQGYGQQALLALEQQVKALGFDTIRLHVFGHNPAAWALYEKMGYVATNVTMAKRLER